jgi:hypothetical protein
MREQTQPASAKARGGRPPKFREARRPITVTLPERTLRALDIVDRDRARAIVRVTEAALSAGGASRRFVDVVEVLPGLGIILVGPSRVLARIPWLRLIELAPMRYLLSIPSGTPVDSLELALHDLLEVSASDDGRERAMLEQLGMLIRTLRRHGGVSKGEMLFLDTTRLPGEWKPGSGAHARSSGGHRKRDRPPTGRPSPLGSGSGTPGTSEA